MIIHVESHRHCYILLAYLALAAAPRVRAEVRRACAVRGGAVSAGRAAAELRNAARPGSVRPLGILADGCKV
jgi:hypothetical protein